MAASYPSSTKSFTTKATNDTIQAAHVNDLQDEVVAIEDALLNGLGHSLKPTVAGTNAYDLGVSGAIWRDLNLGRNALIGGTLGVTGVLTGTSQVLTGIGTVLDLNGGGAAVEILASGNDLILASNTNVILQLDKNNNSTSTLQVKSGAGTIQFQVSETGQVTTNAAATTNMADGDIRSNGALWITDGVTAPTTTANFAAIYVDVADGDLKVKFGDGTVKTLATDT